MTIKLRGMRGSDVSHDIRRTHNGYLCLDCEAVPGSNASKRPCPVRVGERFAIEGGTRG